MEIKYTPTVDDVLAFERYQAKHGPLEARIGMWLYIGLALILLGAVPVGAYAKEGQLSAFSLWYIVVFGVVFLAAGMRGRQLTIRKSERALRPLAEDPINNPMFAEHCITLNAAGIHVARPGNDSTLTWAAVGKIVPTEEHAFFYESPMSFIAIVPRRCFREDAEYKAFVEEAQAFLVSQRASAGGKASGGQTSRLDGTRSGDAAVERLLDGDVMEVRVELSDADLSALLRYEEHRARLRRRRTAPVQWWLWVTFICIFCSLILGQLLFGSPEARAKLGLDFLPLAVICFWLALRWWNHRSWKRARAQGFLTSTITITPTYYRFAENSSFSDIDWRLVECIDIVKDSLFLALAASAEIIPFRVFQTDDERVRFIELARKYHRAVVSTHP
jgi:YcxB-like protein